MGAKKLFYILLVMVTFLSSVIYAGINSTVTSSASTTYNFVSGAGTNKWAWQTHWKQNEQSAGRPASPGDFPRTSPASSAQYGYVNSSNNVWWQTDLAPGRWDWNSQMYTFKISENRSVVANIQIKWEGHGSTGGDPINVYTSIWNSGNSSWLIMNSSASVISDVVWVYDITSNWSNYIDATGNLSILLMCSEGNGVVSGAFTDYIEVSIVTSPFVGSVGLYEANRATAAASMNPQSEYAVKVRVQDSLTLNNLSTVKVTLYYDSDGVYSPAEVPASGNTQTCAILTCAVNATPTWTISPNTSASWSLVSANCIQPALSGTGGDFWFHFKVGKVATQTTGSARWHIHVNVSTTAGFTVSSYQANLSMNWYGEIVINTSSVDWGIVSAGLDFADSDPSRETNISVTYISNGNYSEQVASEPAWYGASSHAELNTAGNPGPNQFSLRADRDNTLAGSVLVILSYATFGSGTRTSEGGNTELNNSLWLKLGIPFVSDSYTGVIGYRIAP